MDRLLVGDSHKMSKLIFIENEKIRIKKVQVHAMREADYFTACSLKE